MGRVPATGDAIDLETAFSEVALALFAEPTVQRTLQRIVDLADHAVDSCDAAGILIIREGTATTAASSNPYGVTLDRIQIDGGEGPCVHAATAQSNVYAADLADDERWPAFSPRAVAAGVRSVLAFSLSSRRPSALALYSRLPAAFSAIDRAKGQLFATLAGLALDHAEERAEDEKREHNLVSALRTRELIGQAQGILMERDRITADQAFNVLRVASQQLNIKLREVAASLVETGESPAVNR
jgi:hypothetical protein